MRRSDEKKERYTYICLSIYLLASYIIIYISIYLYKYIFSIIAGSPIRGTIIPIRDSSDEFEIPLSPKSAAKDKKDQLLKANVKEFFDILSHNGVTKEMTEQST